MCTLPIRRFLIKKILLIAIWAVLPVAGIVFGDCFNKTEDNDGQSTSLLVLKKTIQESMLLLV